MGVYYYLGMVLGLEKAFSPIVFPESPPLEGEKTCSLVETHISVL